MHRLDIDKEYLEYIESDEAMASDIVLSKYRAMQDALGEYIDELAERNWKAGFSYAFALLKEMSQGEVET